MFSSYIRHALLKLLQLYAEHAQLAIKKQYSLSRSQQNEFNLLVQLALGLGQCPSLFNAATALNTEQLSTGQLTKLQIKNPRPLAYGSIRIIVYLCQIVVLNHNLHFLVKTWFLDPWSLSARIA